MTREEMINRLLNCVVPLRFASYPRKWYEKLTYNQLFRMCQEIEVDGPSSEDYIEDLEPTEKDIIITEEDLEVIRLKAENPAFPYRFNPDNGEYEVYTDSHRWEKVYD